MLAARISNESRSLIPLILLFYGSIPVAAQQSADPDFDAKVSKPAFTFLDKQPKLLFDEAHNNFHTTTKRYQPFADLMANDGYLVTPNKIPFAKKSLEGCDVLVISNALGENEGPACTDEECDAIRDWVQAGGGLLLIADHAPFGGAVENLAKRFAISMSTTFTIDIENHDKSMGPTCLVFSRENKLLGNHAIVRGRGQAEAIRRVTTFTGQSLKGPEGSVAFLTLADTAEDFDRTDDKKRISAAGRAQGVAFKTGKGRVVVMGEAAVLSAQVIQRPGPKPLRLGMNFPGSDNRQLALNIVHWLSRVLE